MPESEQATIPKARLDALVDAVFGVAMTLLVIGVTLPDGFAPKTSRDLLDAVIGLQTQFIVYVITFFVVGLRWLGTVQIGAGHERVSYDYAKWTLVNLFLISCLPFSTMMVGRYDGFFLSVAIYAANTALSALASMWLIALNVRADGRTQDWRNFDIGLVVLIATALMSVAVGWFSTDRAMLPYVLNIFTPAISRLFPPPERPPRGQSGAALKLD